MNLLFLGGGCFVAGWFSAVIFLGRTHGRTICAAWGDGYAAGLRGAERPE